jgi:Fusaric acid resistance protein-like
VPTHAVKNTSWVSRFFKDIRHIQKSSFSLTVGLRAAAFVIAPIIIGFVIQQPALSLVALGAALLTSTEKLLPTIPSRILLLACFTEAASFGLGTLAATTNHLFSPILLGIAVFAALAAWANTKWVAVGMFTAIIFAVGVGLPGSSIQSAGQRTLFSLIGTLWALLGVEIQCFALSHRRIQLSESENAASEQQPPTPRLAALRSALMIGIASALGYTIGFVLGLPRDFWIIVTIIVAVRPNGSLTITFTSMMIIGTIAGALIAAVILLETTNFYLLLVLLFSFAVVVFANTGVNVILTQIFLVPFIIIFLNIYYPGEWYLSFIRILSIAIGGTIGVAVVYLLSALTNSRLTFKK